MGWFSNLFSGENKSTVAQPQWATDAAEEALALARQRNKIGYVPYMGPEVASFAPQQVEAMQSVQDRSSMFQHPGQAAPQVADSLMPDQDFGGGMHGYSSFPGFQAQMAQMEKMYPGMAKALRGFGMNPVGPGGKPPLQQPGPGMGTPPLAQPPVRPPVQPPVQPPVRPPVSSNLGFGSVNPFVRQGNLR